MVEEETFQKKKNPAASGFHKLFIGIDFIDSFGILRIKGVPKEMKEGTSYKTKAKDKTNGCNPPNSCHDKSPFVLNT